MFAVGDVVFEDGGHVFLWVVSVNSAWTWVIRGHEDRKTYLREDTLTVADQQTSLAADTVADDNKLLGVSRRLGQASADRLAA